MSKHALLIGNSDGIGRRLTQRLLDQGWRVSGLSRSPSSVRHDAYTHEVCNVRADGYRDKLSAVDARDAVDLCVYCAGIGEALTPDALGQGDLAFERHTFEVNLMGAIHAFEIVGGAMLRRDTGHFIALSSLADATAAPSTPSYNASKAGMSVWFESLGLTIPKGSGVAVTNVRFGFVDTKMAKAPATPFKLSVDQAVDILLRAIDKRPLRVSRPRMMVLLVGLWRWLNQWKIRLR